MPTYKTAVIDGQVARQRSDDGGNSWVTETLLGPAQAAGDGLASHVTAVTEQQTSTLNWWSNVRAVVIVLVSIAAPFAGYQLTQRPVDAPPAAVTAADIEKLIAAAQGKAPPPAAAVQPPWTPENVRAYYDALIASQTKEKK